MKKILSCLLIAMMLTACISASAAFQVIQKGDKGDAVKTAQTYLIEQGFLSGKADGDFGGGTEKAVKAFQAANGLEETGIVDEATYEKLAGWDQCEHVFDAPVVTAEVSCTADGEQMSVCSLCGKPEYETIPATGHNLVQSAGTKVCTICGMMEGEVAVGSQVTAEDHAFEVKDVYYTTTVSEKRGSITYSMMDGSYMVVKLAFTNLAGQALERWNSNRVTDISLTYDGKYSYEGEIWTFDDIVPLDTQNLYVVYSVPAELKNNTEKSVIAEFTIDGEYYVVGICKAAVAAQAAPAQETAAASSLDSQIRVGDERTDGESFAFTVKDVYYTTELSEKHGNVTYSTTEGSYMVVKLVFTNLAGQALERWNSNRVTDISLTYDGKYNYDGEIWAFDDIVPLDTQNLYIYFSVPEALKDIADGAAVAEFTIDGSAFSIVIEGVKIKG